MKPSVLIADDEPALRQHLEQSIARVWPDANIVASTGTGEETRGALRDQTPDVAFLDIRMPSPNGLELAEEFADTRTLVVFVTAYDQYAIEAFEKNACDYLLKPISESRLADTVERLKKRLDDRNEQASLRLIRQEIAELKERKPISRLMVQHRGATKVVDVGEIHFFKSDSKYTVAYDADNEYLLSTTLKELEEQLATSDFWRIHRNCIVNVDYIDAVQHSARGSLELRIKDRNGTLRVSRAHQYRFRHA